MKMKLIKFKPEDNDLYFYELQDKYKDKIKLELSKTYVVVRDSKFYLAQLETPDYGSGICWRIDGSIKDIDYLTDIKVSYDDRD